ncbi:MAG: class II glutamine amidotransferase [Candidatus Levyibacteriota bacterium]
MCELFALSTRIPTEVRFSFEAFSRRGGLGGRNKDGWGVAYYQGNDIRLLKEPAPAADSACVRFLQEHPFASSIVVSHVRRATQGVPSMGNTQPFARELGGRMHVFAHNGDLDPAALRSRLRLGAWHPVGDTDSEYAFCALLELLAPLWRVAETPALEARREVVLRFAAMARALGPANFIYADGDALFVHGHRRMHGDGLAPHPPGLHVLSRHCAGDPGAWHADGVSVAARAHQDVLLAASVPLTDEPGWRALAEGELVVARAGQVATSPTIAPLSR